MLPKANRIESLDILRGMVMVLMALDHVRDYTHFGYFYDDPTLLSSTTPALFFTRWITHFCAPVFVFLAGTSSYLYGQKQASKRALSRFLFTRGLWLIFIELTVVTFAWFFDPRFGITNFQVIWAIGICMVFLSLLIRLPPKVLLGLGLLILFGHNTLDTVNTDGTDLGSILWYLTHQQNFILLEGSDHPVFIFYPFLPWLGIMILGYALGPLYAKGFDARNRKKWLSVLGLGSIALFALIRLTNFYGDPSDWSAQESDIFTAMSFLNTTKYPPSLLYALMTLGPALLFLRGIESIKNSVTDFLAVIGRVPFFFYIIHLYLIHLIGMVGLNIQGVDWKEMIFTPERFASGYLADKGFPLYVTYLVWIGLIALLYPICFRFMQYKSKNRAKWWLSYL